MIEEFHKFSICRLLIAFRYDLWSGHLHAVVYVLNYCFGRRECLLRVFEVYIFVEFEIR
jgi:hypothetical protein